MQCPNQMLSVVPAITVSALRSAPSPFVPKWLQSAAESQYIAGATAQCIHTPAVRHSALAPHRKE